MSENYHFPKHFDVEEANALLPYVRKVLLQVQALFTNEQQAVGALSGKGNGKKSGNGGALGTGLNQQERIELANELLRKLMNLGIIVQDWRRGLVDFPHLRDGREVLLCYEFSDGSRIRFYHDLDAGYAGRKPIDEEK